MSLHSRPSDDQRDSAFGEGGAVGTDEGKVAATACTWHLPGQDTGKGGVFVDVGLDRGEEAVRTERQRQAPSMRYLIVKPSSLGDILHAMPAVSALAKADPDAAVDWVVKPAFAELPPYLPCVRRVIPFYDKQFRSLLHVLPALFRLRAELRRERYDAVIDLQGLIRSAVIGRLPGCAVCAGPAAPREPLAARFYTRRLKGLEPPAHAVDVNNARIREFLGRDDLDFSLTLPVNERNAEAARRPAAESRSSRAAA